MLCFCVLYQCKNSFCHSFSNISSCLVHPTIVCNIYYHYVVSIYCFSFLGALGKIFGVFRPRHQLPLRNGWCLIAWDHAPFQILVDHMDLIVKDSLISEKRAESFAAFTSLKTQCSFDSFHDWRHIPLLDIYCKYSRRTPSVVIVLKKRPIFTVGIVKSILLRLTDFKVSTTNQIAETIVLHS